MARNGSIVKDVWFQMFPISKSFILLYYRKGKPTVPTLILTSHQSGLNSHRQTRNYSRPWTSTSSKNSPSHQRKLPLSHRDNVLNIETVMFFCKLYVLNSIVIQWQWIYCIKIHPSNPACTHIITSRS